MRVVFMGKHKRSTVRALELPGGQGADVAAVVAPEPDAHTAPEQRLDLARSATG